MTQQTAYRLPLALLERLDRHVERLRRAQPGVFLSRADVVRALLNSALDHVEALEAATAAPPAKAKRAALKRSA